MTSTLWQPIDLGAIHLEHRLAMAPMTRARSTAQGVPTEMNATYYAQRASMAVIISEGTQPSEDGQGYPLTPGIYSAAQIAGWRVVTDAVHDAGGKMIIQLMHTGRIGHPLNTQHGRQPVAPSRVKPAGQMFTSVGTFEMPPPRALSDDEVANTVQDFRLAAASAMDAGADGVEIHAANGYLIHQFLSSNANVRTDHYGGPVENRIRFALEVASAVAAEIGGEHTGVIISPENPLNDIVEENVDELYGALVRSLPSLGLAYLNVVHGGNEELIQSIRRDWPSALLLNRRGADLETRINDVESGLADVITVGTQTLANPDLVERVKLGAPLNDADRATFYGGGERGYIDYPLMERVYSPALPS
ncbi:MAG: alkene reductase [Acidimicrobiales bacterium]|jgi:N-ethylmaleimide reductase